VFLFQFFFNIAKTFEIRYTYENQIFKLIINSIVLNTLSLASTYYSIDHLLKGNLKVIGFFILGSATGKWFAMTHFENYRAKILNMFKDQK
jgi:hypothetical protein